jgi:hypothetical protein
MVAPFNVPHIQTSSIIFSLKFFAECNVFTLAKLYLSAASRVSTHRQAIGR